MLFLGLARNIAILLALCMCYTMIFRRWRRRSPPGRILAGVVFGAAAVIGMLTPIIYEPGIIFDGRSILISAAGLFGGGLPAVISAVIASVCRIAIGGAGAFTGCGGIVTTAALGAGYHHLRRRNTTTITTSSLYLFGLVVHVAMLLWMLTLPGDVKWQVLRSITIPVMLLYPLGTVLLGRLLADQDMRFEAEQALRESERKYRRLFEELNDAVFLADTETGLIVDVNSQAEKLLGRSREEIIGMHQSSLHPPGEAAKYRQKFARHVEQGHAADYDGEVVRKDGAIVPVAISATCLTIDGEPRILGLFRDITEPKRVEENLKRYQLMVQSAGDAIFFKDLDSRYVVANPKAVEAFGLPHQEMIGKSDEELMGDREEAARNIEDDQRVFRTGKPHKITKSMTGADGRLRWFEAIKVPQFDDQGRVIGLVGIARDITERRLLEEQLRQSQKMEAIGQLAGGIAHDFNNQLVGIMGYADMLVNELQNEEQKSCAQAIVRAAQRSADLTEKLLAFARKGKNILVPVNIHVCSNGPSTRGSRSDSASRPIPP